MDERELDRAIDNAAASMMAREPSRALSYTVMAHVREDTVPAPRRFVWMTAAASIVLCGAIAIALMNRAPTIPASSLPPAAQLPITQLPIVQPPIMVDAPVTVVRKIAPTRRAVPVVAIASRAASTVPLPPDDVFPIEPIQTEPIVLSAIEVPQLEREPTSIDTLSIEALTIEPLAASND